MVSVEDASQAKSQSTPLACCGCHKVAMRQRQRLEEFLLNVYPILFDAGLFH